MFAATMFIVTIVNQKNPEAIKQIKSLFGGLDPNLRYYRQIQVATQTGLSREQ